MNLGYLYDVLAFAFCKTHQFPDKAISAKSYQQPASTSVSISTLECYEETATGYSLLGQLFQVELTMDALEMIPKPVCGA